MPLFDLDVLSEILYLSLKQFQINRIQVISGEREDKSEYVSLKQFIYCTETYTSNQLPIQKMSENIMILFLTWSVKALSSLHDPETLSEKATKYKCAQIKTVCQIVYFRRKS